MKKIIIAVALVAMLGMYGQANAVCVSLGAFCDQIELKLGVPVGNGFMLYGDWDYTCGGTPLAQMGGLYAGGHAVVATWWENSGIAWQFDFNVGTGLFDMYQTVPGSPPALWLGGYDFSFVPGDCPFAAPGVPAAQVN